MAGRGFAYIGYQGCVGGGGVCAVSYFVYFFGGLLECVGHSFAYVAHFGFLRDVWMRYF
jgi:hypothetical protein